MSIEKYVCSMSYMRTKPDAKRHRLTTVCACVCGVCVWCVCGACRRLINFTHTARGVAEKVRNYADCSKVCNKNFSAHAHTHTLERLGGQWWPTAMATSMSAVRNGCRVGRESGREREREQRESGTARWASIINFQAEFRCAKWAELLDGI